MKKQIIGVFVITLLIATMTTPIVLSSNENKMVSSRKIDASIKKQILNDDETDIEQDEGQDWLDTSHYIDLAQSFIPTKTTTLTRVRLPLKNLYTKISKKEIIYIPNGINIDYKLEERKIKQKDYILFAAGRIIPLKGCHLMLSALIKLNYTGKILIIGDADQMPVYKKNIIDLSKNLNLDFIGLIKDKNLLIQ